MQSTLLSLFAQVSDPRRSQGKMYPLPPILLFTVLAMLAGATSYRQVHAFIRIHLDRLNAVFGVSLRKAPAYTTVRFILRGLDGVQLERVFRQHAAELSTPVAHDGDPSVPTMMRHQPPGSLPLRASGDTSKWLCPARQIKRSLQPLAL